MNALLVAIGYAEVYRGAPCQVYCREVEHATRKGSRDGLEMRALKPLPGTTTARGHAEGTACETAAQAVP